MQKGLARALQARIRAFTNKPRQFCSLLGRGGGRVEGELNYKEKPVYRTFFVLYC